MKKLAKVFLVFMLCNFGISKVQAQIIVNVRPARPERVVVRRPPPPSPQHVWVEEDWVPRGNSYVWHGGYWVAPPRPGAVYIAGHWRNQRRGSVWVPGHWR